MRRSLVLLLLLPLALGAQAQGPAANYPIRPVKFIVPYTPGMIDATARAVAQHLSDRLGQPVVVENRPGAGGQMALEVAKTSAPDGYTLVLSGMTTLVLVPAARKVPTYDPLRDFTSVTILFSTQYYLVAASSLPVHSVQDLIAAAKAQPGKLHYASIGAGSGHHLVAELFSTQAGIRMMHVPYKGSAMAQTGLLGGEVQVMFEGPGILPHVKSGKVRALASTGRERARATPEVPTVAQSGLPGFQMATWFGMSGPAGLPRPIVDRLNREAGDFVRLPSSREKLATLNIELAASTPEEMTERIRSEIPLWTKVMRSAGVEPQ